MDHILSVYLFLGQVCVERGTVLDSLILQTFMDTMLKSNPQTQQRSNHNGQEVVEFSYPLPSHLPSVTFTPDVLLLSLITSLVALFQTSLWSSGFGMKMEAITPFLGKYRPFMGRCCQTCTPKSWVSDGRDGPPLESLGWLGSGREDPGQLPPSCLSKPDLSLLHAFAC